MHWNICMHVFLPVFPFCSTSVLVFQHVWRRLTRVVSRELYGANTQWAVNSAFVLTALVGSMRGLSMAIVMQLRKMMTSTIWSNILWAMILLHTTRNLDKKKKQYREIWNLSKTEVDLTHCVKQVFQQVGGRIEAKDYCSITNSRGYKSLNWFYDVAVKVFVRA